MRHLDLFGSQDKKLSTFVYLLRMHLFSKSVFAIQQEQFVSLTTPIDAPAGTEPGT